MYQAEWGGSWKQHGSGFKFFFYLFFIFIYFIFYLFFVNVERKYMIDVAWI